VKVHDPRADRDDKEVRTMDERTQAWQPSPEEIEAILAEMRPIIEDFARRAKAAATAAPTRVA
jgi:hypothetical protein